MKKKQKLRHADPEFKRMEVAVNKAHQAENAYVLSTKPELARLKENGTAKQRFVSELGQVRAGLEADGDGQLAELVAKTGKLQVALEARFPEAFKSVDAAVEERNAKRNALNNDPEFQARNRAVVNADKAVKEYERKAAPNLAQLAADAKAYIDTIKSPNAR